MIEQARAIADAVLYEGFLLFPYTKTALKNQMPFQFGVVMPRGYADTTEPPYLRSEFLVSGGDEVRGILRFLEIAGDPVEREVPFAFNPSCESTRIPFTAGALTGEIGVNVRGDDGLNRVALTVENRCTIENDATRKRALRRAFISAHVLLEAQGGAFPSLLDPPEWANAAASACVNERAFPVLVGENTQGAQLSTMLLVSPIILYDFPQIAAASRAHTFDGTEVDELLMLSVASLTEEEKAEARSAHPFVRDVVERAESLDAKAQESLHGRVTIGSIAIGPGSRVRVLPKGRSDVWDDLVRGMTARVSAVRTDLEGKQYIGVLFDDDPASEMHEWYGRSFFYGADEVEPLE